MPFTRVRLLGQLALDTDSGTTSRFRTYKTGALLAYLAYNLDKAVPREEVIDMLWPDTPLDQARNSLSQAVSSLRPHLGDGLVAERHTIRIVAEGCITDVDEFRKLCKASEQSRIRGELDRSELLANEAGDLWTGEFLPGVYEDWTLAPREHLRSEAIDLFAGLVRASERRGDLHSALRHALRAISIEPTRESSHRAAIELYDRLGEPDQCLRQYRDLNRSLKSQLGIRPSAETREKVREALGRRRAASPEALRPSRPLSAFFGRETELSKIAMLVNQPGRRLITITGPGGIGKTRLSTEAASAALGSFSGGAVMVELATAVTGDDIWPRIAAATLMPPGEGHVKHQVLRGLEGRNILLVLDNFEQIRETGGPAEVVSLIEALPALKVLVTSRRRLGVEGETEIALDPLPIPEGHYTVEDVSESPAIALFLDRAVTVCPDFGIDAGNLEPVVALCTRLEGIPLALELAASRMQVLTPEQMLDRMDERLTLLSSREKVARHRTLRNAIAWSYEALPDDLQRAFRRLSVFRGGWTEALANEVTQSEEVLDHLADLREFSLIRTEAIDGIVRFSMLETLREFALEVASPDEVLESRARHAEVMANRVEIADRKIEGREQGFALREFRHEAANILAALEFAIEVSDVNLGLRICGRAGRAWHLLALLEEGRNACGRVLAMTGGAPDLRARALNACARLCFVQGSFDEAERLHQDADQLNIQDREIQATTRFGLATVAYARGRYEEALEGLQQVLAERRALEDWFGYGGVLHWIAIVLTETAHYDRAIDVLEECLEVRLRIGDEVGIIRAHNSLGLARHRLGRLDEANENYQEALKLVRVWAATDHGVLTSLLINLAGIAREQGDSLRFRDYLDEALRLSRQSGLRGSLAGASELEGRAALDAGNVTAALQEARVALELRVEMRSPKGIEGALELAAMCLSAAGDEAGAAAARESRASRSVEDVARKTLERL